MLERVNDSLSRLPSSFPISFSLHIDFTPYSELKRDKKRKLKTHTGTSVAISTLPPKSPPPPQPPKSRLFHTLSLLNSKLLFASKLKLDGVFRLTRYEMNWPHHRFARKDGLPNYNYPQPPPPSPSGGKISPAVLFIAVVLAVLFVISALLHLLVRLLARRRNLSSRNEDDYPEISSDNVLQRQLHHLFNQHDSGLDQAFIDALPMFSYEEIMGPKEPFDCAVCLCEFSDKDKLRLLPTCSHAFHIACIDTWLLSNSTCPLCRAALYPNGNQLYNPIFEPDEFRLCEEEDEFGENGLDSVHKKMAEIRLGKFRKLNVVDEIQESRVSDEASNSTLDARRCYSMGSYQYVVGDANLRVAFCPNQKPKRKSVVRDQEHSNGVSRSRVDGDFEFEGKKISSVSRGDSYSVSKIWLWQKKGGLPSSSSGEARIDLSSLGTTKFPWIERSSSP